MKMILFAGWGIAEFLTLLGVYRIEKFRRPTAVIMVSSILTGMLSLEVYRQGYGTLQAVSILIVLAGTSAAMIVDIKDKRIPNYIVFSMALLQTLVMAAELIMNLQEWKRILMAGIINPVIIFIVLLLLSRISRDGIGMGDVKLLTVMGYICGAYVVLNTMIFSLLACVASAMILVLAKKKKARDKIAFGPFIYIGFITNLLLGL